MLFDILVRKYDLNISGVIHIGAHAGAEYKCYKRNEFLNIMLFEPLPKVFDSLKAHVNDGAIIYNVALGNETKVVKMFVDTENKGQSSSILEPKRHLDIYPNITFDKNNIVEVDMAKLDDYNIDPRLYNLINIDVQGYELEVLKGAKRTLTHVDYVMAEVNKIELYSGCVLVDELDEYLITYGFERVHTVWSEGNGWGDALYIKVGD